MLFVNIKEGSAETCCSGMTLDKSQSPKTPWCDRTPHKVTRSESTGTESTPAAAKDRGGVGWDTGLTVGMGLLLGVMKT